MPINTNLLVAAPMLQDFLIDKDGTPMAGGKITLYHDNSRTTLKNWYYQSGTPGQYTYVPLPNPLTLSASGTICDINGVDTIPFYYPYDEQDESIKDPYYITIVNQAQTNQITRANFPFSAANSGNSSTNGVFNLITNGGFWRNIQPNYSNTVSYTSVNLTNVTNSTVSPSQHDGFSMPDVQFFKSNTSATDSLTFTPFLPSNTTVISGFVTPEYYINHHCTSQGSGETYKYYQFPIALHLQNLANQPFTFSMQAQNGGTGSSDINIKLLQFTGTGTSSPASIPLGTITLSTAWKSYTITTVFPDIVGLTLGSGQDDAFYLQIGMPLNAICSINFTKPSIYLTTGTIPANDFQTYDMVDAIINSPRTGDIRVGLNTFYPYGWVPMNNGTIGNNSSNATSRAAQETWPLFNLLWTYFGTFYPSLPNVLAPMFNSAGTPVNYGSSAIADFNANNQLSLSQTMGKVLLGTVPITAYLGTYTSSFTAMNNGGNLSIQFVNFLNVFNGMPIYFTGGSLPSNLLIGTVYYVSNYNGINAFLVSTSFANALAGTVLTFAAGSGTVYMAGTGTFEGEYAHTQLIAELATHNHAPLSPLTEFYGNYSLGGAALFGGTGVGSANTTANTGLSTPFNVTQPGVFCNMYIKL